MISRYDVRRYEEKHPDTWFSIDEKDNIINKEDGEVVCSLDTFVDILRKKNHCDFESVYYCHATLQDTIRCKECGTVIFATDDEWGYDPNLCCPTCGGYKTSLEYWTADEIENDQKKKNTIEFLEQMEREEIEAEKRRKKRNGKYDWQIGSCRIKLGNRALYFDLECDNLFRTKLRGLRLQVHWAHKDGISYYYKKNFTIPLSFSSLRIQIHIHSKKWKEENRRYFSVDN